MKVQSLMTNLSNSIDPYRCEECQVYIDVPTNKEGRVIDPYDKKNYKCHKLVCSYCLHKPEPINNRFEILDL